ncbi:MAG: glycoside hydrolase family 78 protein, partial [Planctomycetota bacterium]
MKIRIRIAWALLCCVAFLTISRVDGEGVPPTQAEGGFAALNAESRPRSDSSGRTPGSIRVRRLRCEYQGQPLGIDHPAPRLSWILESPVRGEK